MARSMDGGPERLERLLAAKAKEAEEAGGAVEARGAQQKPKPAQQTAAAAARPEPLKFEALAAASTSYATEALGRQMQALAALSAAKTPQEMVRIQAEFGKKTMETYVEQARKVSGMMGKKPG